MDKKEKNKEEIDKTEADKEGFPIHRVTFSLITQGKYKFYSLTLDIGLLAKICFVTTREENADEGFQRVLDKKRAQAIADYLDEGLGTIPNCIVLSAQPEAELELIMKGKILQFIEKPNSFLVLDGQHRVYGFNLAKIKKVRVPVVIYNGLSRQEESRIFIDINTKQRPVPNELLLDIKRLAEYETNSEHFIMEIFDLFNNETDSPLLGLLSSASKSKNKLTRVTFNQAMKPLVGMFNAKEPQEVYEILRAYIEAFLVCLLLLGADNTIITRPTVFRVVVKLFKDVGERVNYKYGSNYSVDNFLDVLQPMFLNAKLSWFTQSRSIKVLYEKLEKELKNFTI